MIHRLMRGRFWDPRNETIWLTIYADLITNLMLLFLALYGLTVMGSDALMKALESMKFENEKLVIQQDSLELKFEDIIPILKDEFKAMPDITVSDEAGLARISFGEKVLFNSGQAELKSKGISALLELASILVAVPYTVVVEGHTDNVPMMKNPHFKDNRDLSLARAMAVIELLTHQGALPADQLAAAAYGEYRPRSSNLTEAGRQINRRVEIVLVKDFPYGHTVVAEEARP